MAASRTQTVAPTTTPIDVAELKSHLRIDHAADDADLLALIGYVTADVETYLAWQLCEATWRIDVDRFEAGKVLRPLPAPLIAVSSIDYFDADNAAQTVSSGDYEIDAASLPARIRPTATASWPNTYNRLAAVSITFTAGHATVAAIPGWAKLAIREACAERYEMRLPHAPLGESARALLQPHRLAWQFGQGFAPFEEA